MIDDRFFLNREGRLHYSRFRDPQFQNLTHAGDRNTEPKHTFNLSPETKQLLRLCFIILSVAVSIIAILWFTYRILKTRYPILWIKLKKCGKRVTTRELHTYVGDVFSKDNLSDRDETNIKAIFTVILKEHKGIKKLATRSKKFKKEFPPKKLDRLREETENEIAKNLIEIRKSNTDLRRSNTRKSDLGKVMSKRNPYLRFCDTYYYFLWKANQAACYDDGKPRDFLVTDALLDLMEAFPEAGVSSCIQECLHENPYTSQENEDQRNARIILKIWTYNSDIYQKINKSLYLDSCNIEGHKNVPAYFKDMIKGKPADYYKFILEKSIKYILFLKYYLENDKICDESSVTVYRGIGGVELLKN